jgi:hypothetical protein
MGNGISMPSSDDAKNTAQGNGDLKTNTNAIYGYGVGNAIAGAPSEWDKITGEAGAADSANDLSNSQAAGMAQQMGYSNQMNDVAQANVNKMAGITNTYTQGIQGLLGKEDTQNAMTLQQAQDPNNPVAKAFQGMYNQQAANSQNAGTANVGVMQALGAQALGNQMGNGVPMSGANMQALLAGNQAQAGQAMANVQNQYSDLRNQGIQQGILQTQNAYNRGQQAIGTSNQLQGELYGANSAQQTLGTNANMQNLQRQAGIQGGYMGQVEAAQAQQAANAAQGAIGTASSAANILLPWTGAGGMMGSQMQGQTNTPVQQQDTSGPNGLSQVMGVVKSYYGGSPTNGQTQQQPGTTGVAGNMGYEQQQQQGWQQNQNPYYNYQVA